MRPQAPPWGLATHLLGGVNGYLPEFPYADPFGGETFCQLSDHGLDRAAYRDDGLVAAVAEDGADERHRQGLSNRQFWGKSSLARVPTMNDMFSASRTRQ
ncbi:MAG: hypothetical protein NOF05_02085 [Candidatus Accumulibacter phosphatis]|uniref:Uncharacterized protein n=1 Tax=Candidatus Accumulibacter cognatus TaxID=2954383 RepID=A0A7D5S9Y3_9PROT|nr:MULTISPECIES: hypothetical protein [Candidatus Accumulibacter]MBL8402670.1 hypothetical protein [Accumulibacter sp.]MBN8517166.1 hypothetical protein [Accumulibacter sp.]MBO3711399.1 hypothetical protein [Accumulibacter sp.]MCM8580838.1 hypothetical protein [Accumulibacter sp.]MCQ1547620.1 hypothetical protein [Candidatus Accumulibacter phosphatis]